MTANLRIVTPSKEKAIAREVLQSKIYSSRPKSDDMYILKNTITLLDRRNDLSRIEELVDLFYISEAPNGDELTDFYYWYKNYPISTLDAKIYHVYDEILREYCDEKSDPCVFAKRGTAFYDKLAGWIGDADNPLRTVLNEYFHVVIKSTLEWNPALLFAPKSLLGTYGWGIFIKHIENTYKGRDMYLNASKKDIAQAKSDDVKLAEIEELKQHALNFNNLKAYNKIEEILSSCSIDEAYEKIIN